MFYEKSLFEIDPEEAIADTPQAPTKPQIVPCDECGLGIPRDLAVSTYKLYGEKLCSSCLKNLKESTKKELLRV